MKILVLGASGRTGSIFTRKALEEGHMVTAYVRNPDKTVELLGEHQNLMIVPGALNDSERLATISSGQDVMVSILGQKATVREFLSTTFMQKRLPLIMDSVVGAGVKHCVIMSAYGVGDTLRSASFFMRVGCKIMMRSIFTDRAKADAMVAKGKGGAKVVDVTSVAQVPGIPTIAREDVADALLNIAGNPLNAGTDFLVTIDDVVLRAT